MDFPRPCTIELDHYSVVRPWGAPWTQVKDSWILRRLEFTVDINNQMVIPVNKVSRRFSLAEKRNDWTTRSGCPIERENYTQAVIKSTTGCHDLEISKMHMRQECESEFVFYLCDSSGTTWVFTSHNPYDVVEKHELESFPFEPAK